MSFNYSGIYDELVDVFGRDHQPAAKFVSVELEWICPTDINSDVLERVVATISKTKDSWIKFYWALGFSPSVKRYFVKNLLLWILDEVECDEIVNRALDFFNFYSTILKLHNKSDRSFDLVVKADAGRQFLSYITTSQKSIEYIVDKLFAWSTMCSEALGLYIYIMENVNVLGLNVIIDFIDGSINEIDVVTMLLNKHNWVNNTLVYKGIVNGKEPGWENIVTPSDEFFNHSLDLFSKAAYWLKNFNRVPNSYNMWLLPPCVVSELGGKQVKLAEFMAGIYKLSGCHYETEFALQAISVMFKDEASKLVGKISETNRLIKNIKNMDTPEWEGYPYNQKLAQRVIDAYLNDNISADEELKLLNIAINWQKIVMFGGRATQSVETLLKLANRHEIVDADVNFKDFVQKCTAGEYTMADYIQYKNRWNMFLKLNGKDENWNPAVRFEKSIIPAIDFSMTVSNGTKLRFFKLDDSAVAASLFIGVDVKCCQHPIGEAGYSAFHSAYKSSGIYAVETEAGEIFAESWGWMSGDVMVMDNVEAKLHIIHDQDEMLREIYMEAARRLCSGNVTAVVLGERNNDMDVKGLTSTSTSCCTKLHAVWNGTPEKEHMYWDSNKGMYILAGNISQ